MSIAVHFAKRMITTRQAEIAVLVLIAAVSTTLLFANLGDQCLWQDEAETALIAKTVLSGGLPRGSDGRNSFSQEMGRDYAADQLPRLHGWLPFYVVAGFFATLGTSTFVARVPFVLAGLATVPLVYAVARHVWQSRRAAALAAIVLATSVPYLILCRQCRYYGLAAILATLGLYAYLQMLHRKRLAGVVFIAATVLLFHTHYPYWAVLLGAVVFHAAVFRRDRLVAVGLASSCSLALIAPWIVWLLTFGADVLNSEYKATLGSRMALIGEYLLHFQHAFSPALWVLLVIVVAVVGLRSGRLALPAPLMGEGILLLAAFVVLNILVFSMATPHYFFRYLTPVIPALCVLAGGVLEAGVRVHPVLGGVTLAAVLLLSPMRDYLYEITHHYRGPIDGIVEYLGKHGTPDDIVAITYGDLPVKFYTRMRVVGGLTGEDLSPALEAKWVIIRRHTVSQRDASVAQYFFAHLRREDYRSIELDCVDLMWNNRECPDLHAYRTVRNGPPVVIFERTVP
jgi:4-amino-4-deoxy-L-arabinose transferase-like glycosyltransferase